MLLPNETKVGFVDQRRALKRVIGAFPSKVTSRQAAQFVVDERNQCLARALVPLTPIEEKFADPFGRCWIHVLPPLGLLVEIGAMLTPQVCKVKPWSDVASFRNPAGGAPFSPMLTNT
jgi:hypothetical protein